MFSRDIYDNFSHFGSQICLGDCTEGNKVEKESKGRIYRYTNDMLQDILKNPDQKRGDRNLTPIENLRVSTNHILI